MLTNIPPRATNLEIESQYMILYIIREYKICNSEYDACYFIRLKKTKLPHQLFWIFEELWNFFYY